MVSLRPGRGRVEVGWLRQAVRRRGADAGNKRLPGAIVGNWSMVRAGDGHVHAMKPYERMSGAAVFG